MKKNYSTQLSKRLGQYGSLALAITGLTEANSQVVYTDVNPDYSGSLGSSYAIDFDNDGTDDITFVNYASYFSFYALYANPTGTNEILGSISGGFTYPFALNSGDTISSGAGSFFDNSYINSMNWWGSDGNWIGVTDKYLGVKFDISGQTHFGWIRLDVSANSTFIVKDYAYESTPNTLILAGDQVGALPCAAPTALTVDTYDENSVDFSWTASVDETDGYDWAIFAENADINNDTPILTGNVATGITNASATGLNPNTPYDIYVQTNCASSTSSDWEGPLNFTTDAIPCAAPTALTVDTYDENGVDFSWTASADETDGYDWAIFAENADINTDTPILTGSVATGITNASATGLDPETPYDIYVQTNCASNTSSDWEGPLNFTTDAIPCAAPTALTVDTYDENSVDFSWTASADETDGYDWAIFAENADINTDTPILTGSVATGITNASATGLDPETPYDIYVQTNCTSNTFSDWEGPLNFTTETLSIENYSELSELKFYPNPVSSILNLESNQELKSIEIFDLLGKKVKEIKLQNTITKINMSSLEKGTYFLKVYSVSSFEIIKVIKE